MNRRHFLIAAAASAVVPTAAFSARGDDTNPFGSVGPFKEDAKTVYEFLAFSCTYCQQHHDSFVAWGRSIPKPVVFEPVPVVVDLATFSAARAFYAVRQAAPRLLDQYCSLVLNAFRHGAVDAADQGLLARVGVDRRAFDQAWKSPAVKTAIQDAAALTLKYDISATPTLAIGGTTVLTADMVNGDYGMLTRLASGFVSRMLEKS